jgi:biotin carboxyl carrier protein
MPGTVLSINVAQGDTVKEGDAVVILEAMKMENEINAPCSGTVTSVCVSKGESVDSGKVLVTIG